MAFRYLIYSTGTAYASTIVRESATNNPGANEASYYTDFIIPEIQPLYLWRVDNVTTPTAVIANTEANVNAYLAAIAPAPEPEDDASVGFVTGITSTKIDKVTGAEPNISIFNANGGLDDSGYEIGDLTGGTSYNFVGSGGTQVFQSGSEPTTITIYSTDPTGATVTWGNVVGTLSNQVDLQNALNLKLDISAFNNYTGDTETALNNKLETSLFNTYTGDTETALDNKLEVSLFNTYTGDTETALDNKLESSIFNTYTGDTQPVIDAALTGVTSSGTGTTIGSISGRNVSIKTISAIGGVSITGDANNLIISGETNAAAVWGNITGTLSAQTDLQNALNLKMNITDFNNFTGTTLPANYYNKTEIDAYTGATDTLIGTKLDTSDFNTFTGTTLPANYYNKTEIDAYTGATDTRIDALEAIGANALTGATNGLNTIGRIVELGGGLTKDTLISGTTFDFTVNTDSIKLQGVSGIDIIDTDGLGGINIESDAGTVAIAGNTNLGAVQTKLEISETLMRITDSRTTKVGMVYAADYSSSFTSESLITKRYADAIVQGLDLKESVKAASASGDTDIDLTGGTFGGTLDGYTLQDGDRVLIKNQDSNKEQNGIYVYSSGGATFGRAIDFINPNVTSGAFTFVETGTDNGSSGWVLVTQDPINVGTTLLDFTRFSESSDYSGGVGIDVTGTVISVDGGSLAGNSIAWTGNTFNVDINSGTLSTALAAKLNVTDFEHYSGTTVPATYLSISDFNTFTGTTLSANYYNKTEINTYTGATDTRLDGIDDDISYISGVTDTKLDTAIFTGYTASTATNEIFLIHTGGTELNTIAATAIEWDAEEVSGAAFSWTGSSEIEILETGSYELNYNIPYNAQGAQSMAIGGNVILNNTTVIDLTAAAGFSTDNNAAGNLALPTVILSLTAGDVLVLAAFRTGRNGSTESSPNGSILIKKKNTLQ